MAGKTYYEILTEAISDIAAHGFDSEQRIAYWTEEIRRAAEASMKTDEEIQRMVRDAMGAVFRKQVENGGVLKLNPGVSAYTLARIKPELHAELSRRISASTNLIKLNREQAIAKTEQRFRGWATSVPKGGSETVERVAEKTEIRKALASLPYTERRCITDQNHKLVNAINTTVAVNGGAIGAIWRSHKHQAGYNGRPKHNARDEKFFLIRNSWAHESGLVKPNSDGYTDQIDQPSEEINCRCAWQHVFSLRSIPQECLTEKGREALAEARRKIAASR